MFCKNRVWEWTGFDDIKQHFCYCGSMTGVLNKPGKVETMIDVPKGYNSKKKVNRM